MRFFLRSLTNFENYTCINIFIGIGLCCCYVQLIVYLYFIREIIFTFIFCYFALVLFYMFPGAFYFDNIFDYAKRVIVLAGLGHIFVFILRILHYILNINSGIRFLEF